MLKAKKSLLIVFATLLTSLISTPAFARSISLKEGGIGLWIFLIIGAIIILLQLIPAAILFFSFIGTMTGIAFRGRKQIEEKMVEEKVLIPEAEPVTLKK